MPLTAASALLALLLGCRQVRGPDVVLLTIDTLRADHVGALHPDSPARTPAIDALAADGVVYEQAFSPISVTGPAFVSLFTGQTPGTHGVVLNTFRGGPALAADRPTLTTRLHEEGFRTAAFVSGFTLRSSLGLATGFELYEQPVERVRRRPGKRSTSLAIGWVQEQRPWSRLFLWWHTYDAHGPFDLVPESAPVDGPWTRDPEVLQRIAPYQRIEGISDPRFYAARYAAAVERTDQQVGRIVKALKEAGRYDNALIVLTADHGESLAERELWFDHGTHASVEQLHVPLVIKYPRGERAGQRVSELVELMDLAPTVLDQLDLDPLPEAEGRVLGTGEPGLVMGESSHCKDEPVLTCAPRGPGGKELSLRDARWSLLRLPRAEGSTWVAYDRQADPKERQAVEPERAPAAWRERLHAGFEERAARGWVLPTAESATDEASAEETEALRALGYVE